MNAETPSTGPSIWQRLLVGKNPKRTLWRIAVLVGVSWFAFTFVLQPIQIQGISMLPTYRDGRYNLINKWAYRWHEPRRGDVVSISYGRGEQGRAQSVMLLKRIIGLPGERVAVRGGVVYINGEPLDEPYVRLPRAPWEIAEEQLGPTDYYVIGDNRTMPLHLHEQGKAFPWQIRGKVVF